MKLNPLSERYAIPFSLSIRSCVCLLCALLPASVIAAQGTRQWTTTRFDDFEKGTPQNIAIRNDGRLEAAPVLHDLASTSAVYVWCVLPESDGGAIVGTGATTGGSRLLHLDAKGTSTVLADFKESNVQSLLREKDGSVLAATSPSGKVYRVKAGATSEVVFDPGTTEDKPKYLWSLASEPNGDLLVAAGAPAAIYRIPHGAGSKPERLFHSGDQHIRSLAVAPDGTIYAGSDGAGLIYRITPLGKAFALYAAPKHEITSLALDAAGNLYAAAVGDRRSPALPQLPAQGEPRVPLTFAQPGSSVSATTNAAVPDGSEVYRIAADGTPQRLLSLREDVVYSLLFRNGALFVATGNHGRVYRMDPQHPGLYTDVAHTESSQAVALVASGSGLLIATANSGKVLSLSDAPATDATYLSDAFDAEIATLWGRIELTGTPGIDVFARSGNVENPGNAAGELWSDWKPVAAGQTPLPVPASRYLQWKAVLHPGASLDAVTVNYLQRNLPPTVDDLVVQPGARVPPAAPASQSAVVPVVFRNSSPAASAATSSAAEILPGPLLAQRDRTAVTARWVARDPNNDDLMFAVYFRDVHEQGWHLIKDHVSERALSFDSALLPDGDYELRVVASDAPVHMDADTLQGERISAPFTVDTTPPVPGPFTATLRNGRVSASFSAQDATSPITHAEFSLDAGPWQYLEPAGKLSDALKENYTLDLPVQGTGPHTVAIRVFDRYENAVTAKAVAQPAR